jgi:pimeloyl-ACP methyl ester carboxylesterase
VHLVGNSFGGTIAFGLAAARPDRVASIAVIESEPATETWAVKMAMNLARAKDQLVRPEALAWITQKYNAHTTRLAKGAARLLHSTSIAEDVPASQVLDTDQIAALRAPVLALYGSESDLAAQAPALESTVDRCRTVIVPDQEHSVLIERTALTLELTLDWVREHANSSSAVR